MRRAAPQKSREASRDIELFSVEATFIFALAKIAAVKKRHGTVKILVTYRHTSTIGVVKAYFHC